MNKIKTALLALMMTASLFAAKEPEVVRLYQIGEDGKYCLSLSPDAGSCVSGTDDSGNTINVLDFIKGKQVVFENLSDSPHDMKISGNNAEDLPAQAPNGSAVQKEMAKVDMDNQKITCSFHGDQLAVGYRVPDRVEGKPATEELEGHGRKPGTEITAPGGDTIAPPRAVVNTGLADVGKQIMAKGKPEDVEKLVAKRPELMKDLEQARPLLAQEIAARLPVISQGAAIVAKGPDTKSGFPGGVTVVGATPVKALAVATSNLPASVGGPGATSGSAGSAGATDGADGDGFIGEGLVDIEEEDETLVAAGGQQRKVVLATTARGLRTQAAPADGSDRDIDLSHLRRLSSDEGYHSGLWMFLGALITTLVIGWFLLALPGRRRKDKRDRQKGHDHVIEHEHEERRA